jgi:S1-C subfamily serine protease
MRSALLLIPLVLGLASGAASAQSEPTLVTRERALQSLVYVSATGCADGTERAGSGFALERPDQIITAHHVVGGCSGILVKYEGVPSSQSSLRSAKIAKVLRSGDLAALTVSGAPTVPFLVTAQPPPNRQAVFMGFGYQNGQLSGGDVRVTFSTGHSQLKDILTADTLNELAKIGSPVSTGRNVLRFNVALQPGMSGGPIIDVAGNVIGIVAGGLKAGAAPASWGWPSEWLRDLLSSSEDTSQSIRISGSYYTLSELTALEAARQTGRSVTCGALQFSYRGRRLFDDVARGADDVQRVEYIVQLSTLPRAEIGRLEFDVWLHEASGATVVTPAGYSLMNEGPVCVARSSTGPFSQVVWGASATDPQQVQMASVQFETTVMAPRVPPFPFQMDLALTTFQGIGIPGPQLRDNGMVFNRKGYSHSKGYLAPPNVVAHSFETLVAKGGSFMGVGTINDNRPLDLLQCVSSPFVPQCQGAREYLKEWTLFILATQLSTYPSY